MDIRQFMKNIEDHSKLVPLGMKLDAEEQHLFIECNEYNKPVTELSVDAIQNNEWDVLEEILIGEREPEVLYTMTRCVGYFSRIQNFNASKVAERAARMNGNYHV